MIETDRLLLRPMRPDDAEPLLAVFADPTVMASFDGVLFDRDDMERWVRRNLAHQARFGYGLFSVLRKPDGLLIGDCGLEHPADDPAEAELGYDLRSDHWGHGLAAEAAAAVRDHAFGALGISRLISFIRHGNERSRRVAERIGMRRVEDVVHDGQPYRCYRIDRSDPAPHPPPSPPPSAPPRPRPRPTVARPRPRSSAPMTRPFPAPGPGVAEVNGTRLAYEVRGAGHPLVLLHAGIADARMWDDQIDAFAERYLVVRCDARGVGRSDPAVGAHAPHDDLAALLAALGIERAHLLGLSMGGAVALDAALAYPALVSSLVLAAARPSGLAPSKALRDAWTAVDERVAAGDVAAAIALELRMWVDGPGRDPDAVDPAVRERVREMDAALFALPDDGDPLPLDPPAVGRLAEVSAPTLVLDGVRARPGATALRTSCVPGDGSPCGFYRALGFAETGEMDGDEIVMRLAVPSPNQGGAGT